MFLLEVQNINYRRQQAGVLLTALGTHLGHRWPCLPISSFVKGGGRESVGTE